MSCCRVVVSVSEISAQFSGTTCSVVIHFHETNDVFVAHVGDSRCVMGRKMAANRTPGDPGRYTFFKMRALTCGALIR